MLKKRIVKITSFFVFALPLILPLQASAQELFLEPKSGFYQDSLEIKRGNIPDSIQVYYTLDGSIPDTSSQVFQGSIVIRETSAFRAVTYSEGFEDTVEVFRSYFINETTELPVLSITSDPDGFFSDERGIYVEGTNGISGYCRSTPKNWNQDWERPVRFEFFEKDRNQGFSIDAGVKIGGGCTRLYPQKSLDIFFRSKYGASKLNYQLFEDKPITEFDRLALRNGGQDWHRAMIRNAAIQSMVRGRMDLGYQAFKPVVVFLNGEYWGIHILREKQNEDFIESNYGYDENELDILTRKARVKEGSADHYNAMIDFIEANDLSIEENYRWVEQQMDVNQFIDYQITQIYTANGDWPGGNIIFWRPQIEGGKWKWILYDSDMAMNSHSRGEVDDNSLYLATSTNSDYYANPPWSTLILRSLLTNEEFKNKFIQRYSTHMWTTFKSSRLLAFIDSTKALIESEVPRHVERWKDLGGYKGPFMLGSNMNFEKHIEQVKSFIRSRTYYARNHLKSFFNLTKLNTLETLTEPAEGGNIYVETVRSDTTDFIIVYNGIPVNIKAEAKPGYTFTGWSGVGLGTESEKQLVLSENSIITAHFKRSAISETGIVINEINYRSADNFNPEDWVELYNNSGSEVDMSGWYFSDSKNSHQFFLPEGTILEDREFLVLVRDSVLFQSAFPSVSNFIGNMDFGLSGDGELVRLFDDNGAIVDQLTYNDKAPWPEAADGEGPTLALTNPGFDNADGNNWAASSGNGTPGAENSDVLVSNELDVENELPTTVKLNQNYPNPFNPVTTISYTIDKPGQVSLKIFDITGREVAVLENSRKAAGVHEVIWNAGAGSVSSGVYFYRLEALGQVFTRKLTLIK